MLDGKPQFYVAGQTEFEGRFIEIPDGEHRVTFLYAKDDQSTGGNDTVYLDGFERLVKSVPAPTPAATVAPVKPKSSGGGSFGMLLAGLMLVAGGYRLSRTRKVAA